MINVCCVCMGCLKRFAYNRYHGSSQLANSISQIEEKKLIKSRVFHREVSYKCNDITIKGFVTQWLTKCACVCIACAWDV
jgi:hypothetical protein